MNVEGLLKSSKERSHIDASPQDVRPHSPALPPPLWPPNPVPWWGEACLALTAGWGLLLRISTMPAEG